MTDAATSSDGSVVIVTNAPVYTAPTTTTPPTTTPELTPEVTIPGDSNHNVGVGGDVGVKQIPLDDLGGFKTEIDPTAGGTVSGTGIVATFVTAVVGVFLFFIKIIFGGGIIKFFVYIAVTAIIALLFAIIPTLVPENLKTFTYINQVFAWLPDGAHYFLSMFAVDEGIPILLGAYVAKFLIRRIPFIG